MTYEDFEKQYHIALRNFMRYGGAVARGFAKEVADLEEAYPEFAAVADMSFGKKKVEK